jgi:hypothetical protein
MKKVADVVSKTGGWWMVARQHALANTGEPTTEGGRRVWNVSAINMFIQDRILPSTWILPTPTHQSHQQLFDPIQKITMRLIRTGNGRTGSRRTRICCLCLPMAVCLLAAMMISLGNGQESDIYNDEEGYNAAGDYGDAGYGQEYGEDSYQDYNNNAQDSQQEQQDNLYADYAARQEMKELGGGGG